MTVLERTRTVTVPSVSHGSGDGGMLPPIVVRKTGGDDGNGNGKKPTAKDRKKNKSTKCRIPVPNPVNYQYKWTDFDHLDQVSDETFKTEAELGKGYMNFLKLAIMQETALGLGADYERSVKTTDTKVVRRDIAGVMKEIADIQLEITKLKKQEAENKKTEAQAQLGDSQVKADEAKLSFVERGLKWEERSAFAASNLPELKARVDQALSFSSAYRSESQVPLQRSANGTYYRSAGSAAGSHDVNTASLTADLERLFDQFGINPGGDA